MKGAKINVSWVVLKGQHRIRIKNTGDELARDVWVLVDWDNEGNPEGLDCIEYLQPKEPFDIPFQPPKEYEESGYCKITVVIRYAGRVEPHTVPSPPINK